MPTDADFATDVASVVGMLADNWAPTIDRFAAYRIRSSTSTGAHQHRRQTATYSTFPYKETTEGVGSTADSPVRTAELRAAFLRSTLKNRPRRHQRHETEETRTVTS